MMAFLRLLRCLLFLSICTTIIPPINCEVYTSVANLEDVLQTESLLIDTLENYLRAEEEKIGLLKR